MWNEVVEQAKCGFCIHTIDSSETLFEFQHCLCGEVWNHTWPEFILGSSNPGSKWGLFNLMAPHGLVTVSPLTEAGILKNVYTKNNNELDEVLLPKCENTFSLRSQDRRSLTLQRNFVCFFPLKPTPSSTEHWTYFLVFSFFSRALACCSLIMVALTCGGFMCTFNFPPTRRRTVAANLVWVFSTCGGCFSMMNVLWRQKESRTEWQSAGDVTRRHFIKFRHLNHH